MLNIIAVTTTTTTTLTGRRRRLRLWPRLAVLLQFGFALALVLILVPGLSCPARAQEIAVKAPVLPADARTLFAALPSGDADWKLVESKARSDYSSDWVQVILTRAWEGRPLAPAAAATAGAPAVVPRTKITLTDTGGFPAFNSMFLVTGNPDRTTVESFPAIRDSSPPADKQILYVWVSHRFILRIETEHQPRGAAEAWLPRIRTTDLQTLAAKSGSGITKLPNPIPMFRVDELNPRLNRTWPMAWTDEETIRRANITDR